MDKQSTYLDELKQEKDERIKKIIEASKELFNKYGIINTKISKIASKAHVGEATVYRYFNNKTQLATLVANSYWEETSNIYNDKYRERIEKASNGLEKVRIFLEIFKLFYTDRKPFMKYMHDYDIYMMNNELSNESPSFDDNIKNTKQAFATILKEGQEDGSIKRDIDAENLYHFVSQVLAGTTTKLALRHGYLESENDFDPLFVIEQTIDMFINYIKK